MMLKRRVKLLEMRLEASKLELMTWVDEQLEEARKELTEFAEKLVEDSVE